MGRNADPKAPPPTINTIPTMEDQGFPLLISGHSLTRGCLGWGLHAGEGMLNRAKEGEFFWGGEQVEIPPPPALYHPPGDSCHPAWR